MTQEELIKELAKTAPPYTQYKDQILYSGPYWDHREIEIALKAFLTGKWLVSGEYVARFQNLFAQKFGVQWAHMVNSGSSANLVMISALKKLLGWQDGDEIIVSPVGFPTTIAPLIQNDLKPVFADIEMDTLNFSLEKVESKIGNKTRAIFVSPVLGNPPDMDIIRDMCTDYDLYLIGDNCDSLGTKWDNRNITDSYFAWSTSFYPAHHITTGEGGMVCSDSKELIDLAKSISWWGRDCYCVGKANTLPCGTCGKRFDKWLPRVDAVIDHKYVFKNIGYNLKPLDFQGAIGIAQLEKFDEIERKRRENFGKIKSIIRDLKGLKVAYSLPNADPCWFGVPIICDTQAIKESLVAHLESNKIQTRSYFAGNLLHHEGYSYLDDANKYPNANKALTHVFFLGCPPQYTDETIEKIKKVIMKWTLSQF